uniref:DUF8039 domain-containing protein n=1 Tax=Setaria viridis TaxID=4556 RepID=A0A4V6D6D9_SETVI|nr:hypothetical protein SEVIR_5G125600v2 [Setaria viridis]
MLGSKGEPILPEGIAARFWNICGAIVRDKLQTWITTSNWKNVPTTTKDVLWATLKEKFTFLEGQEDSTRKFAEGLLGRCFRNWRSILNTDYVKKGKNARNNFGRIPLEMWEEFVQQKNTLEAKALSEENTRKDMKATENPHHLGAGGYAAKIAKWRREKEEWMIAAHRNWVLARISVFTSEGKVTFKHPTTMEIYESLEQLAELQKKGLFKLGRERDQVTAAIGTAEHSGRVRGMSSTLPWGKAFQNDQGSYKKWECYKKNLEEKMRAIANARSIANVRYPIDEIQVDTPCRLVATGIAIMAHVFPKEPPPEYSWVQVVTVLDESCELNIPTDEGIEVLGDAMNQYILWHRRDIILNINASPEISRMSQDEPMIQSNVDVE